MSGNDSAPNNNTFRLYYVYARWVRVSDINTVDLGRYLLTCASRYHADELFRALPDSLQLRRISAQLWQYDPRDGGENTLREVIRSLSPPMSSIIVSQLSNTDARHWELAPPQAGRDWINNRTYFIRNIRQPDIYWFHPGSGDDRILASRIQKTMFLVVGLGAADVAGGVLIRRDSIRISPAPSAAGGDSGLFVRRSTGNKLMALQPNAGGVDQIDRDFTFQDLLGRFGTAWEMKDGIPHEYVTWSVNRVLDEWELC